jgi:magnesium chelatase subunit D
MNQGTRAPKSPWTDATLIACLVALDPSCGVVVKASAGPVRDHWLALVRGLLPKTMPWRRVPLHATDARLLGGLDFAATLAAGRPIAERGLFADADGGMVVLAMAERMTGLTAARLAAVLDHGAVVLERDGLTLHTPARFGVIALDEGAAGEERPPSAVLDRSAFHIDLDGVALKDTRDQSYDAGEVAAARALLPHVRHGDEPVSALCAAALALGVGSLRAPLLALRAARGLAALAGRIEVLPDDVAAAARLVLAPRATVIPAAELPPQVTSQEGPTPDGRGSQADDANHEAASATALSLDDIVLTAAQAAIPAALLAQLQLGPAGRLRTSSAGRSGVARSSPQRGRPVGVRNAERLAGARLNVIETLRAAAPWQRLRRPDPDRDAPAGLKSRVAIRRQDFRVNRFKQRTQTTSIFVVDASGSAALHRLAEVKGAVELLLAECYVRRDQVALLAFRGRGADLILPPTRSLVRAKRSLAGLPGGGATPLAAGIDAAARLADAIRRKGQSPLVILMTDGRANIARNGDPGRVRAEADALLSAQQLRTVGAATILVDTSPQPTPLAAHLAVEMGARYLPLPRVDAEGLSQAILGLPAFANRELSAR